MTSNSFSGHLYGLSQPYIDTIFNLLVQISNLRLSTLALLVQLKLLFFVEFSGCTPNTVVHRVWVTSVRVFDEVLDRSRSRRIKLAFKNSWDGTSSEKFLILLIRVKLILSWNRLRFIILGRQEMSTFTSTFEVNLLCLSKFYRFPCIKGTRSWFVVEFVVINFKIGSWGFAHWCWILCELIESVFVTI